ncbi:MAG: putative Ig domain-containing protein, partial [Burkholderiaceae bacterium]|nr:putative Ig domain-containing protein [Burkholderiaceae bacterium]
GTSWSSTAPTPSEGSNTVNVRQTDAAGNVSAPSAPLSYTLDTAAPSQPTVDALSVADNTPTITGTAALDVGETLTVTVGNVTYNVGDGHLSLVENLWALSISGNHALGTGSHQVVATVTDAAGTATHDTTDNEVNIVAAAVPPPAPPLTPVDVPPVRQAFNSTTVSAHSAPVSPTLVNVDASSQLLALGLSPSPIAETSYALRGVTPMADLLLDAGSLSFGASGTEFDHVVTSHGENAFQISVVAADEPQLLRFRGIPDQNFTSRGTISIRVPVDAFVHTDPQAVVHLSARLATGEALPDWLIFDATTGKFSGTAPLGSTDEVVILVEARDGVGRMAEAIFRIKPAIRPLDGRSSLTQQLKLASREVGQLAPLGDLLHNNPRHPRTTERVG